ncbi:MAG: 2-oxoacid:acceptor oxidoreductase family protein, partial [Eubacterium sp.]
AKADVQVMNASEIAEKMGNARVTNVVLMGAIIKAMGLQNIDWNTILHNNVKPKFVDLNIKAIAEGMNAV